MAVDPSIFKSTKEMLDIAEGDDSFDNQVLTYINGAFADYQEFGIGPSAGFVVTGEEEKWDDLEEDPTTTERLKNLTYLKVKLVWDPPQTSFLLDAHNKQIEQATWRLINRRDGDKYLEDHPEYIETDAVLILDGDPS